MTTFQDSAVQGLNTLVGLWNHGDTFKNCSGGGCFWMAGNFFHTAVDSMSRAGLQDTNNLGQEALDYFGGFVKDTTNPRNWRQEYGYWVDDYGWWGIAFMHAYLASNKLGYGSTMQAQFAKNAGNCWEALNACWDNSPINWQMDGKSYTITGGIPNTLGDATLAGRNCVTNECYWRLSSFLGRIFGQHYLDPNANANNFFLQAKTQSILFNGSGLVYERFLGLPNTDYPDWTWLGDQGLFAISCYFNLPGTPVFDGTQAKSTINAVQTNNKTATGVLHEDVAPYNQFRLDYACGKGTFMRNLAYVNDDQHNQFQAGPYDPYIKLNAMAVWRNQRSDGSFPYYWDAEVQEPNPDYWGYTPTITANAVLHAAGLSAINAALPWLKDQSID
jgi:hypothetical protein